MIKKVVKIAVAVAFVATATGVVVVGLSYALYALLRETLTPAAASAIVAGVYALVLLIAGLAMLAKNRARTAHEPSVTEKVIAFAREKPLIAGAAVLGASFVALRNPGMLATLAMGLMAPKSDKKR